MTRRRRFDEPDDDPTPPESWRNSHDAWEDDRDAPLPGDLDDPDNDDAATEECPECGAVVYEGVLRCPRCGSWIVTATARPARRGVWFVVVAMAAILIVLLWTMGCASHTTHHAVRAARGPARA
ncbi:MAG: hypothetical protein AB7Q17_17145 [Phycisphaerae bacterium]